MRIDVRIPYAINGRLADAYNMIMSEALTRWVLIVEHDVFLACNPDWYKICLHAVDNAPKGTGMITCVTSGSKERNERPQGADFQVQSSNICDHVDMALRCFKKHGTDLKISNTKYMAGFFMLVNKEAWRQVRFKDQGKGVHKIDQDFCERLILKGYDIAVLPGLYVYHKKKVRENNWL